MLLNHQRYWSIFGAVYPATTAEPTEALVPSEYTGPLWVSHARSMLQLYFMVRTANCRVS